MFRSVCKQLSSILSNFNHTARSTNGLTNSNRVYLQTSSKGYDKYKDSVRQKGVEVTTSSSSSATAQQITPGQPLANATFPTLATHSESFDGIQFNQLHIIHVKATNNNTIVSVTDGDGKVIAIQSAGTVGFRNARKGTNVAAQAAAIALADDAVRKDIKQARVCLRGIGPGRFPALKAIEMSGIKVVSITDTTPLPHNGNRPKKVRRL